MSKNKMLYYRIALIALVASLVVSVFSIIISKEEYIAFVPNASEGTVSIIDLSSNEVIDSIEVGESVSHGIAVTDDGNKIYTGNLEDGEVFVYDGKTKDLIKKINTGRNLHGIDITPDGKYVFTTSGWTEEKEEFNYINIIDTSKDEIIKTIKSDRKSPAHIDFSSDSKIAYVTNVMSNDVSMIDVKKGEIIDNVKVGIMPNESEPSPDGKYLFVANVQDSTISIIDIKEKKEIDRIKAGEGTHGVAVSSDGKYVWTTNRFSNDVTVIDIDRGEVIKTIKTGGEANHISISPKGDYAYVANMGSEDISVIDTKTYEITKSIDVGKEPHEIDFIKR